MHFSLQARVSSPRCVFGRAAKQIDLAQTWCSSQNLFQASCRATEYLKDPGFHGENTKKNETCRALEQRFSSMGYFAPQRTSDNIWDHSWLSQLEERMFLAARGETQINMLQCTRWPSQGRVIWLKCQQFKWLSGKESTCKCRRHGFNPWVRKIPCRRKWQPTPVFLLGKSHGQRRLAGHSPWGCITVRHKLATKQL